MKSLAPLRRICPTRPSSTAPRFSLITSLSVKPLQQNTLRSIATNNFQSTRHYTVSSALKMSSSFSNTDTGSKPADPYKAKNLDETSLKEKVEDLVGFVESCKFGMMTTRIESSGLLVSRCMALAAKVCSPHSLAYLTFGPNTNASSHDHRKAAVSTSSSTPIPNLAKLMTSKTIPKSILRSSTHPASGPRFRAKPPF